MFLPSSPSARQPLRFRQDGIRSLYQAAEQADRCRGAIKAKRLTMVNGCEAGAIHDVGSLGSDCQGYSTFAVRSDSSRVSPLPSKPTEGLAASIYRKIGFAASSIRPNGASFIPAASATA